MTRRGKPEDRTHFERARDNFHKGKGDIRKTGRPDVCPTCGEPMFITREYKPPNAYHFTGICESNPDHNLERYGYYSTDTVTS